MLRKLTLAAAAALVAALHRRCPDGAEATSSPSPSRRARSRRWPPPSRPPDWSSTLQGAGPFTVFAPTDEAFAKLPAGDRRRRF
ncbi:MAG: fasciclin domain-containing protein [Chromatiales bacterium]|nr:fasciclin domain-containing protein [Chromatiales bacterium]